MGELIRPNRPAGFDRSHPAAKGTILSTVAGANILNGIPGAFSGSVISMSPMGLAINNTAATDEVDFTTAAIPDRTIFTMAGIVYFKALAQFTALMAIGQNNASASVGLDLWTGATAFAVNPWGGSPAVTSLVKPLLATPMFIAVSCAPGVQNWVAVNLRTGTIVSEVTSVAGTAPSGAPGTTQSIGHGAGGSAANAYVTDGMMSGNFLSMAQLSAWANDLWAFWYPRTKNIAPRFGSSPVVAGFSPWWASRSNQILSGGFAA